MLAITPNCSLCNKGVGTRRKRLQCSQCVNLTHISCSSIPKTEQKHYTARTVYQRQNKNTILHELFMHGFVVAAL